MRLKHAIGPVALVSAVMACGSIPSETQAPPWGREIPPGGVILGDVVYSGPRPCSRNGHVVGTAVLFVFDRRNPPPPNGTASTPVNFGVVAGDVLFPDEPRNPGAALYCPAGTESVTLTAPFSIGPVPAGSYILSAFYDTTGDFLPTFKIRNTPEKGDIGGGAIDTVDALKPINAGNPNYQPISIPIDIGIPQPLPDGSPTAVPDFVLPDTGFVARNVTVTLGATIQTVRPYFYPAGVDVSFDPSSGQLAMSEVQSSAALPSNMAGIRATTETNPNYDPVLTIPQDVGILAPPTSQDGPSVNHFEASFPHLVLHWSLPEAEHGAALGSPFDLQLPAAGTGGFAVWQNATFDAGKQAWVPQESKAAPGIPQLWPSVALTKLVDDPGHTADPASLQTQGSATAPLVVLQAITLLEGDGTNPRAGDSLLNTGTAEQFGTLFPVRNGPPAVFTQDRLTVIIQPAAICFNSLYDPTNPDKRGTLVIPHLQAMSADVSAPAPGFIISPEAQAMPATISSQVNAIKQACLPIGRYSVNIVYPDGQAWTVPNEAGGCAAAEGPEDYVHLACTTKPRPVLRSQGTRAVVEVVKATNPANCEGASQVPAVCLPAQRK